jgi:hypothetical protein
MSIGAPLGARRSSAVDDHTFPAAGPYRIFDIASNDTFIAGRPTTIGRPRQTIATRYFLVSSFFWSLLEVDDEAAPGEGVAEEDDDVPLGVSDGVELDDDEGVDGAIADDEDDAGGDGLDGVVEDEVDVDGGGVVDVVDSRWHPAAPSTSATPTTSESLRFNIGRTSNLVTGWRQRNAPVFKQDRCHRRDRRRWVLFAVRCPNGHREKSSPTCFGPRPARCAR